MQTASPAQIHAHEFPNIAGVCRRAEILCRLIAPDDLAGAPLYVLPASTLSGPLRHLGSCGGYTAPWLSDHLSGRPDYRGKGYAFVVNDNLMPRILKSLKKASEADPSIESLIPQIAATVAERVFFGACIHETAHLIDGPKIVDVEEQPLRGAPLGRSLHSPDREAVRAIVAREFRVNRQHRGGRSDDSQWEAHGLNFIRAVLHCRHRANRHASYLEIVPFDDGAIGFGACLGGLRGFSPIEKYAAALADEAERLRDVSLREILATDPPSEFLCLYVRDAIKRQNMKAVTPAAA